MDDIIKPLIDKNSIITTFTPMEWDFLGKAIKLTVRKAKPRNITVKNNQISCLLGKRGSILTINYENKISKKLNFEFIAKNCIAKITKIKGNNNVYLIDDPAKDHYYITNGNANVFLEKSFSADLPIILPELKEENKLGIEQAIENIGNLKDIIGNKHAGKILIYDDQPAGIFVFRWGLYLFNGKSLSDYYYQSPQLVLKTGSFLRVCGSKVVIALYQVDGQYWLHTRTDMGKTKQREGGGNINNLIVSVWEEVYPAFFNIHAF